MVGEGGEELGGDQFLAFAVEGEFDVVGLHFIDVAGVVEGGAQFGSGGAGGGFGYSEGIGRAFGIGHNGF